MKDCFPPVSMDVIFLSEAEPKPVIVIFEISILPFRTLRVNDFSFPESEISLFRMHIRLTRNIFL